MTLKYNCSVETTQNIKLYFFIKLILISICTVSPKPSAHHTVYNCTWQMCFSNWLLECTIGWVVSVIFMCMSKMCVSIVCENECVSRGCDICGRIVWVWDVGVSNVFLWGVCTQSVWYMCVYMRCVWFVHVTYVCVRGVGLCVWCVCMLCVCERCEGVCDLCVCERCGGGGVCDVCKFVCFYRCSCPATDKESMETWRRRNAIHPNALLEIECIHSNALLEI